MNIDERGRARAKKILEHELGREATEDEVASSYRKINIFLQSIDLNHTGHKRKSYGYEILSAWWKG